MTVSRLTALSSAKRIHIYLVFKFEIKYSDDIMKKLIVLFNYVLQLHTDFIVI